MRVFRFNQQLEAPDVNGSLNEVVEITDEQVILEYFDYWSKRMILAGCVNHISLEACIEDWIVVNWAWEVTDGRVKPPMSQKEYEKYGQDLRD